MESQKYSVQGSQKKRKVKSWSLKQGQVYSLGWLLLLPAPRAMHEKMACISYYSEDQWSFFEELGFLCIESLLLILRLSLTPPPLLPSCFIAPGCIALSLSRLFSTPSGEVSGFYFVT